MTIVKVMEWDLLGGILTHHMQILSESENFSMFITTLPTSPSHRYLATEVISADLFTALNNENNRACDGMTDCRNMLIWRQTRNGPRELFQHIATFNR